MTILAKVERTETVVAKWTLDDEDIRKILATSVCGNPEADVAFDIASDGYLRGATVTLKTEKTT